MSVLSILEARFKDLREEISKMEIEYACKNDDKSKIRKQIQDHANDLEIIESEMINMEKKIEKMKNAESEMKNTYDNIVNSATMLLDTMDTTTYETNEHVSVEIEEEDDDCDEEDSILGLNSTNLTIDTDYGNILVDDGDDDILLND